MPDRAVSSIADRRLRKVLLRRLQLLQADDVRPGLRQPAQQHRQTAIDAIGVVGRDLHSRFMNDARPPREPPVAIRWQTLRSSNIVLRHRMTATRVILRLLRQKRTWRNGRRSGLKIRSPKGGMGSTHVVRTNSAIARHGRCAWTEIVGAN